MLGFRLQDRTVTPVYAVVGIATLSRLGTADSKKRARLRTYVFVQTLELTCSCVMPLMRIVSPSLLDIVVDLMTYYM